MRIAVYSLGCKVNQVELEAVEESFRRQGHEMVAYDQPADVYLINTCSVTGTADRKSRAAIRRARRRSPDAVVAVTGCFGDLAARRGLTPEGADLVIPNARKEDAADWILAFLAGHDPALMNTDSGIMLHPRRIEYVERHARTRAFVKIQDGCESFCSYCIVPYARGRVRSKLADDILAEIRNLVDLSYREIVLTGIHIGQYGRDLDGLELNGLLRRIFDEVPGNFRLRLSSLEPLEVKPDLIALLQDEPRLCRHLHIPLQSGSETVLRRMNRRYGAAVYAALLEELAGTIPGIGLTADVMVGFPGETPEEFGETCALIEKSPLSDLHVFRYSRRPGTAADRMPDQIPEMVKNERSQLLIALGRRKRETFLNELQTAEAVVLTEEEAADGVLGLTDNYVPVCLDHAAELNTFYRVSLLEPSGLNGQEAVLRAQRKEQIEHISRLRP